MKTRFLGLLLVVVLSFGLVSSAFAQSYYFKLAEQTVHVYLNDDGTVALVYAFVFENQPGAAAIEFVDVGMPNDKYDWNSISADVDGRAVRISSDYQGQGTGFAVDLGANAIQPGRRGTVNVRVGRITDVFYKASEPADYASFVFSPTWFGSQYVTGSTKMTVVFHLPPGVQPNEPRYFPPEGGWPGNAEPLYGFDNEGRITYTWSSASALPDKQYKFGAGFPQSYIPANTIRSAPLFTLPNINPDDLMGCLVFLCFGFFFFGLPIIGVVQESRRKLQYLPPKIAIEGHGIKRGLTAVEAAILMEQPLDKVLQMILFGVIKKGAVEVVQREPLSIRKLAEAESVELRGYEKEFVDAMLLEKKAEQRKALQRMMINLVKSVADKMKGFSRRETVDYYKSIMERAWAQIEAAATPEVKSQMFDEALEWTMLDKDYDERTRRTFTGPIFVPTWWGRYDPVYRSGGTRPVSQAGGASFGPMGSSRGALPGADFAASVVGGVQNFAGNVIGNVREFTGGVTQTTNPPPPPSRSSGGGRSGGGCACACACAGCACACAGGGR
ncbi:MAG: hypothetical protein WHV44_10860 [Anaerolineales bacterium]